MKDLDLEPDDNAGNCKHTRTHKLAESGNHICLNCEVLLDVTVHLSVADLAQRETNILRAWDDEGGAI